MANLQRLLTRRPQIDEAEVEDVRERTMARLAALNDSGGTIEPTEPVAVSDPALTPEAVAAGDQAIGSASTTTHVPVATEREPAPAEPAGPRIIVPRTISLGLQPIGLIAGGVLIDATSGSTAIAVMGVGELLICAVFASSGSMRRARATIGIS